MLHLSSERLEDHIVGLNCHIEHNQGTCCDTISYYFGQSSEAAAKSRAILKVSRELIRLLEKQITQSNTTTNVGMFGDIASFSAIDFPKEFSGLLKKNNLTQEQFFTEGSKGYLREEFQRLVGYSSSELEYVSRRSSIASSSASYGSNA